MRTENSRSQNSFRRSCPISIYDVAAVETWLEDLARRGEAPVSFTGSRVDLLPDAPRESRFRLQPFRRRKDVLDPERVAAYRSMGWRLVGKLGGVFWVWRCDDPDAPELDTDPVVQGEGYRYLKRRMIFRTVACGLVWLALLGLLVFTVLNLSLRTLLRQGSWLTLTAAPLVAVSLLAVLGVQLWLDARNTWRLWRTLSAGVPLERPKPYRRQLRLGQLVYAATLVVYTLNLMISFQNMGGSPSGWNHAEDILDRQTGQAPAETVAVSLAELDNVEPSWFSAERKSLPIAPEMYDSRQYAPLPEYGQIRAETAYYRMLTEGLARALTAELTENRAGFYDNLPAIPLEPVEAPGLDGFWWAEEMSGAGNADGNRLSDRTAGPVRNQKDRPGGDRSGLPPGRFFICLFQHVSQVQGDGAVLQDKGGDADAAALLDGLIAGVAVPQGQIGLQVRQAGGQVLELDVRLGLTELVEGIQGIGAQVAADDGDFHAVRLLTSARWLRSRRGRPWAAPARPRSCGRAWR